MHCETSPAPRDLIEWGPQACRRRRPLAAPWVDATPRPTGCRTSRRSADRERGDPPRRVRVRGRDRGAALEGPEGERVVATLARRRDARQGGAGDDRGGPRRPQARDHPVGPRHGAGRAAAVDVTGASSCSSSRALASRRQCPRRGLARRTAAREREHDRQAQRASGTPRARRPAPREADAGWVTAWLASPVTSATAADLGRRLRAPRRLLAVPRHRDPARARQTATRASAGAGPTAPSRAPRAAETGWVPAAVALYRCAECSRTNPRRRSRARVLDPRRSPADPRQRAGERAPALTVTLDRSLRGGGSSRRTGTLRVAPSHEKKSQVPVRSRYTSAHDDRQLARLSTSSPPCSPGRRSASSPTGSACCRSPGRPRELPVPGPRRGARRRRRADRQGTGRGLRCRLLRRRRARRRCRDVRARVPRGAAAVRNARLTVARAAWVLDRACRRARRRSRSSSITTSAS